MHSLEDQILVSCWVIVSEVGFYFYAVPLRMELLLGMSGVPLTVPPPFLRLVPVVCLPIPEHLEAESVDPVSFVEIMCLLLLSLYVYFFKLLKILPLRDECLGRPIRSSAGLRPYAGRGVAL